VQLLCLCLLAGWTGLLLLLQTTATLVAVVFAAPSAHICQSVPCCHFAHCRAVAYWGPGCTCPSAPVQFCFHCSHHTAFLFLLSFTCHHPRSLLSLSRACYTLLCSEGNIFGGAGRQGGVIVCWGWANAGDVLLLPSGVCLSAVGVGASWFCVW
jgi:hypothetical protein